jgi:hypothetical protein
VRLRVRQLTIDGVPMVALIADGGFMIPLDRADTLNLLDALQRELRILPPVMPDNEQGRD